MNEVPLLSSSGSPFLVPHLLGTATAPGLGPSSSALGRSPVTPTWWRVVSVASATATAPASGLPPLSGAGTTPATAKAAATTAFAIPLGTSGVHADLELPAVVLPPIESVHRILGVPLVMVPDKGKATAAPGAALQREVHVADVAVLLKQRHQILGLGTVGQVAHAQRRHPVDVTGRTTEPAATAAASTIASTIAAISVGHA